MAGPKNISIPIKTVCLIWTSTFRFTWIYRKCNLCASTLSWICWIRKKTQHRLFRWMRPWHCRWMRKSSWLFGWNGIETGELRHPITDKYKLYNFFSGVISRYEKAEEDAGSTGFENANRIKRRIACFDLYIDERTKAHDSSLFRRMGKDSRLIEMETRRMNLQTELARQERASATATDALPKFHRFSIVLSRISNAKSYWSMKKWQRHLTMPKIYTETEKATKVKKAK